MDSPSNSFWKEVNVRGLFSPRVHLSSQLLCSINCRSNIVKDRLGSFECEVGKFWENYSENMPSPLFEESLKFMRVLLKLIIHIYTCTHIQCMSYCILFLSHAGSRIWNQTNAGGPRSFCVPHSTMALPDFTGLYVTLTHSSCCWEWYQG